MVVSDDEQSALRKKHIQGGLHWHVQLYMGPMTRGLDMDRIGVDNLHLIYLNTFKHLFKYTVHESLPDSKKKLVRDYVKAAGFYSYDAAEDTDDPVARWIGREVKRFLHEADVHLPFLLSLSSTETDAGDQGTEQARNVVGEEEMDLTDDEFDPTDAEMANEGTDESLLTQNAARWDRFLEWVRQIETPWDTVDSDEYRKFRAVQWFNSARACSRDLYALKPTMASWVPHIACNIVTRQIVKLGDPSRRSADACESYGAAAKKTIKHLTCRRTITRSFKRGYVEQAFRRLAVRADLIHGEENAPYLKRKDERLLGAGRGSAGRMKVEGPHHSVRCKVEMEAAAA
ncbi:hypothetical protein AB1Y20_015167 [Prymnesium parvum]|uniref:Helitron helicase-like domain-containing protein n=1 Tax=Prymnesium parvum TaxID=97485 RepID=A0AB34K0S8_PRYPA